MEKCFLGECTPLLSNEKDCATRFMFPGCGPSSFSLTNHIPCSMQLEASHDGNEWDTDLKLSTILKNGQYHDLMESYMTPGKVGEGNFDQIPVQFLLYLKPKPNTFENWKVAKNILEKCLWRFRPSLFEIHNTLTTSHLCGIHSRKT